MSIAHWFDCEDGYLSDNVRTNLGVAVPTLIRLENGDPTVSMAVYASALWLIGLSAYKTLVRHAFLVDAFHRTSRLSTWIGRIWTSKVWRRARPEFV